MVVLESARILLEFTIADCLRKAAGRRDFRLRTRDKKSPLDFPFADCF